MTAENDEELAEYHRLLYVATTRAADYLILSAGMRGPRQTEGAVDGIDRPAVRSAQGDAAGNCNQWTANRDWRRRACVDFEAGSRVRVTADAAGDRLEAGRSPPAAQSVEDGREGPADGGRRQRQASALLGPGAARSRRAAAVLLFAAHRRTARPHAAAAWTPIRADGDTPLDPRGLGTLVHAVLAEIDFARPEDVAEAVGRHAPQHLPEAEERLDEPIEMFGGLLSSPRAAEIAAAAEVHTEIEFLLAWPPDNGPSVGRYLQGFIDCLYRVADGQMAADRLQNESRVARDGLPRRRRSTKCRCSSTGWRWSGFWAARRPN